MAKRKARKATITALVQVEVSVEYTGVDLQGALNLSKDLKLGDFVEAQGEVLDYKLTIVGVHDYEASNEALYR